VLFEPGSYHRIDNTGNTDLKLFWVYSPPGLEHWFNAIGRERRPHEPMPPPFARPAESAPAFERMGFLPPKNR
jgi:hypothetical protein